MISIQLADTLKGQRLFFIFVIFIIFGRIERDFDADAHTRRWTKTNRMDVASWRAHDQIEIILTVKLIIYRDKISM